MVLETLILILTTLLLFLLIDMKVNILLSIISIFFLSVPNVFLIGNIITSIKYYKFISIKLEDNILYINELLPSKKISRKDKVYNPYKINKGVYLPKKYKLNINDIDKYGYVEDLNIKNDLYERNIAIIINDKHYIININNFYYKDIIKLLNEIYKITNIKPTGELKNIIVK